MTDTIRCPSCRGAKKVPKLGGMIGECNTCKGKGEILAADKVKPVISSPEEFGSALEAIKQVANCVPASKIEHKADIVTLPAEPDIKVDGKKALYTRKTVR